MEKFCIKSCIKISKGYQFLMPKLSIEIPQELLDDLNKHVGG
jgi:hypothetical protein